jgi:hypothetical protein
MQTTPSRSDRGFRRAMLCGLAGFVGCLLLWMAYTGGMASPEGQGRLLFSCLAPVVVTGLIVRDRHSSWARVTMIYVVTTAALLAITVLPKLKEMGW